MDFEEIAMKAYKKEKLDKFSELPSKYAYLKLERIYQDFLEGNMSKQKSIREKNSVKIEYENNKKEYDREIEIYRHYIYNQRQNYELILNVEKTTDKDIIIDNLLQIVSNCITDKSFKERTLKRLNEVNRSEQK